MSDTKSDARHTWRRQDRIDRGLLPGLSSPEKEELAAARRRIAQLETELAVTRRAAELLKEQSKYSSARPPSSAGWTVISAGGRAKISQPPPASTVRVLRTVARAARVASASSL
jgi:hypothetical protein